MAASMSARSASGWYRALTAAVTRNGGLHNAHLHLDRVGTLDPYYWSGQDTLASAHATLHAKHGMLGAVHDGPAYREEDFRARVNAAIDVMIEAGTTVAETLVDVTSDRVGLTALDWMMSIAAERSAAIALRVGAYTPFGFDDDEPERWETFAEGARRADFVGCLPEADDVAEYPTHIGFTEHCARVIELARSLDIPVQVHLDQRVDPRESGTEDLVRVLDEIGSYHRDGEPRVWGVHVVSPTTYDDTRFDRLVDGLRRHHLGVVACPSAALGMRLDRTQATPNANAIPRVLDLVAAGVPVQLGSDNIDDICSPSTTADLVDEVFVLSAAVRFYDTEILAALACGRSLTDDERRRVRDHLDRLDRLRR